MNYAPRVSLPYHDVSGVIAMWASSCDKMAVYEHQADSKVSTTHIHIIMIGCIYKTPETLKKQYYNLTGDTKKGNALWSWTHDEWPSEPDVTFIKYMSNGELRPKFVKNFTDQEIEEQRLQWQDYRLVKEPSQTLIQTKEPKKLTKYDIVSHVFNKIKEQNPGMSTELIPDELWFRAIRKVLIEHRQPLGLYKVVDIYDACIMYHDKNKFLANCLQILEKRKPRV